MNFHCKLVPVQYRAYDINLFLMISLRMSLHCKLVPVQYRAYDINLFLIIFPIKLYCKLVPVQYREYEYGLKKTDKKQIFLVNVCNLKMTSKWSKRNINVGLIFPLVLILKCVSRKLLIRKIFSTGNWKIHRAECLDIDNYSQPTKR